MQRSIAACVLATAIALSAILDAGAAERYPSRPVRMVIPFSAGGATDVPGRVMAAKLSEKLGQQIVVDNRPGAGSTIGSDIVAKAQPDGYTLLMTATPFTISSNLYKKLPFDPLKDFAPVTQFGSAPNVLVVHSGLGTSSVKDLIALAKSQSGKIDYASSGNGSAQHLFGALFLAMAQADISHVPYKGSGPATADLLGGQVKVGFPGIAIALPHHKAGHLRALGVTTAKRSAQMPDVPSIAESVPGYDATLWLGIAAPKNTPKSIVTLLNKAIADVLEMPDVRQAFLRSGTEAVVSNSPEQFAAFVRSEHAKWGKVIRSIGLQVN